MNDSSNDVTERFRQLHELLVVEEHRIKSPIIDEMKLTAEAIKTVIEEVNSITSVISFDHDHNDHPVGK
ncbi:hypothetical protein SAMD00019534_033130 [Acytostelium subglobosum LB1]|uniref:hypothetical protein n=1 Tax=Acytostelium subglobosum LB1 TaxID=1410327 RepID=UPI0006448788|nr:hypothetical protein SAMD00019534_033130 [Acytostelium subglobosum LB1]GAM20138.1 hypothetical protein SAMD00019534_033130 [Acytostelium subglobosum LB1]|eukprot:XP_012756900.1 hypothetical protein SAMD00019534_033130 [Acytostelium subglobosum LB1]